MGNDFCARSGIEELPWRLRGVDATVRRLLVMSVVYLAAGVAFVISVDQTGISAQNGFFSYAFLVASVVFGWTTGRSRWAGVWAWVAFPFLLIPIAMPFKDPAPGTADSATVVYVAFWAFYSMGLVLLSAAVRNVYEFLRRRGSGRQALS
jgi:hypothetical protein